MTDEVLDPFGDEADESGTELAERLSTIDGARIALFSNAKKNADHFLSCVGERLEDEYGVETSEVVYKQMSSSAADQAVYDRLGAYDAVLVAYGDCGSCSSWTIHDALQLEAAGTPTVVFCTEEFTTLCQYESENQGAPGLPIEAIAHPIADLDRTEIETQRVTGELVESAAKALLTPPEELDQRYAGRYTDASQSGAV